MDAVPSSTPKDEQVGQVETPSQDVVSSPQDNPRSPLPFIVAAVVFLILLGAIGFVYVRSQSSQVAQTTTTTQTGAPSTIPGMATAPVATASPKVAQKHIKNAVAAKGIDPKTGEAVQVTSAFSVKDPKIYVVASLQSVGVGTKVSYTRYIKDVLLDHKTVTLSKLQTNNVSFVWSVKKGASRVPGTYTVKLYVDGAYERSVTYTVK